MRIRIGHPVAAADLARLPAPDRLPYLRARVYALGRPREVAASYLLPALPPTPIMQRNGPGPAGSGYCGPAAQPLPAALPRWEVYVAKKAEMPHVLREIGRLRELTFRREGEGTGPGHPTSTSYDTYYRHLLLYDRVARQLVGAYRVGRGRSILREFGKRGFYLHSLFRMKKELRPLLRESLELGRSFIRAEYQKQPLPLALLWKGIAEYIALPPRVPLPHRAGKHQQPIFGDFQGRDGRLPAPALLRCGPGPAGPAPQAVPLPCPQRRNGHARGPAGQSARFTGFAEAYYGSGAGR